MKTVTIALPAQHFGKINNEHGKGGMITQMVTQALCSVQEESMERIKTGLYYVPHKDYLIYIKNCYVSILLDRNGMQTSGVVADIETATVKYNGLILQNAQVLEWIGKV
jgi:hypothetical protein